MALRPLHRALLRPASSLTSPTYVRALSSTTAVADASSGSGSSSFQSPFRQSSQVPDFTKYKSSSKPGSNLLYQYFLVGSMGALAAAGAKSTVTGRSGGWRFVVPLLMRCM